MKCSALAASTLLAVTVQAIEGVIQWDIAKRQTAPRLRKRAGTTFEEVITNERGRGGYFATCKVGTPGQDLTLQLDTGSSDIWVPEDTAAVCSTKTSQDPDGCSFGKCTSMEYDSTLENVRSNICS